MTWAAAIDGDYDTVRRRLESQLTEGLDALRRPDIHVPPELCMLALGATISGDRSAGARLRPLFEGLRPYVIQGLPIILHGHLAQWHIGRLELLAGRPEAAVDELRAAVARADALDLMWLTGWTRVDLATALHRRDGPGDSEAARTMLAEGQELAEGHGMRWVIHQAAVARAELEGHEPPSAVAAAERARPIRAAHGPHGPPCAGRESSRPGRRGARAPLLRAPSTTCAAARAGARPFSPPTPMVSAA